jgi:hypothetical protein
VLSAAVAKKPKTRKKRKKQEVVVVDDDEGDGDNGDDDDGDGARANKKQKPMSAQEVRRDEPTSIIRVCCRRCDKHRCSTHEANNPGK